MKTNSHWLLKAIRVLLTIIWYVNMVLIVIGFTMLTWKFCTSASSEFSAQLKCPVPNQIGAKLIALTGNATNITFNYNEGQLKMSLKNTAANIALAYFLLLSLEALVMVIIFQLRKFFDTLKENIPFQYDNIRRLKVIALCFALLNILHILLGISTIMILGQNVKGIHPLNIVWTENFTGFILGAVIYVMADVFKYGFTLQKENGEFV